ncbi:MAG: hypothetical protein LJE96_04330 [Deltaproteobacteria bacterium]|jgi:hypothetical protein|nr:hypothetical protein [Deltaproteobacteria bacterium]
MHVKEEHKPLLKQLGLKDEDFERFDGKFVRYEHDDQKGVRIYDPYYETSYDEYIGIDGWSAWSAENDTFMSDILKKTHEQIQITLSGRPKTSDEEITEALQKKFGKRPSEDPSTEKKQAT